MRDRHWTDDELISRLFEVGPEDRHLETCSECAKRYEIVRQRYDNSRAISAAVHEGKLTAQRLAVRAQLKDKTHKFRPRLAYSSAVALLLMVVALIVFRLNPPKQSPPEPVSEDQLMEEVYQMSSSAEPSSIEPVQSLFEEQQ
jgi:anti-sigma factor RsiW